MPLLECPYCNREFFHENLQKVKNARVLHLYDEHKPPMSWSDDLKEIDGR